MPVTSNDEDKALCPVKGCDREIVKRGLFMHIFQTEDPEGEGHYPKYDVPPYIDVEEVKITGTKNVDMDYPETQDIGDVHYMDTYTGKAYQGKRGLMVHLGQLAGRENIPEDVTKRHDADDFPIVEVDDDGNITEVIEEGSTDVPPIEPYLPWYDGDEAGYISKKEIKNFVQSIKKSRTGAASPEVIEKELLES